MARFHAKVRRWGSSLATVIPPEALKEEAIQEGDEVFLEVRKALGPADVFGMLRGTPIDTQAFDDETRREEAAAARRKWGDRAP